MLQKYKRVAEIAMIHTVQRYYQSDMIDKLQTYDRYE